MAAHTKQQFDKFMSQLKDTNATLAFYSDFDKISTNVAEIEINLNMLNYLLGKKDLRTAVQNLWNKDPKVFDVIDILIATRKKDKKMFFDAEGNFKLIHDLFSSVDGIMDFLEGTHLDKVLREKEIKNLVDYVFGVETGLDSNAHKNRSSKFTEQLVSEILSNSGINYSEQVSSFDHPAISVVLGADQKVFDFCIKSHSKTYLIEVNFYSIGGSKLNEVARSYTEIAPKINGIPGYEFIWVTDGIGWNSAKNKLEEAFMAIPQIYNLTTLTDFIDSIK